jgi:AraC-like DNA-binding protein
MSNSLPVKYPTKLYVICCTNLALVYPILKKSSFVFLLVAPWLQCALLIGINYKPTIQLWPSSFGLQIYSDSTTTDKGTSGIRVLSKNDKKLVYEYCLGKGFLYPYIGLSFNEDSLSGMLDLSDYDYLEIDFEAQYSQRIPVVLNQNIKGFSVKHRGETYRPLTQELEYDKSKRVYILPLNKFETPSWWFRTKNFTESKVGKPDLARIHYVQFHNCQMLPVNKKETTVIYSLSFHKKMEMWYWISAGILFFYYSIWLIIRHLKKSLVKIYPRTKLVVANMADEDSKKVLDYLANNYQNPELSLEGTQKELGLSETKISSVLKTTTDMSFKRYLNHIRTEEAKRLLRETDRQVMDIAYKVGYGNISHFNRVFKEAENCSPNEYRKNTSGKL